MTFDQFIRWEAASKDTIDFKRVYAHMAGDALAGLMLSQIVFWHLPNKAGETKLRIEKDGNLWMAVPREDWFEAICITARQADRLMTNLSETCQSDAGEGRPPLVEVRIFKFNSTPTPHIRLLHDNFLAVLDLCLDGHSFIQKHRPRGKATLQISEVQHDNKTVKSTSQISKVASQISKVHFTNQGNLITETTNRDHAKTTDREVAATAAPPPPSEPVPFEAIQAAPPEARKPNPQQAEVGAWSAVMELDIHIPANAKRVGNMLTGLRKSKDCQPTADVATWRFGRTPPPDGSWNFYTHTWQGAKGQPPTEREINAYWGAWLRPALKVMPNGGDQPRAAPSSRTERNRQLLEEAMRDATGQPPIGSSVIEGRVIHGRAS